MGPAGGTFNAPSSPESAIRGSFAKSITGFYIGKVRALLLTSDAPGAIIAWSGADHLEYEDAGPMILEIGVCRC